MKLRTLFALLSATGFLLSVPALRAEDAAKPTDKAAETPHPLTIVVVDTLQYQSRVTSDFDRLDLAFHAVAKHRHWPVPVSVERFAANTPDHDPELQVVIQPIRQEVPGEYTYRGWMKLTVGGKLHDFGVVTYRYTYRPGEAMDDVLDKVFRGAANAAADRLEPILFPELARH